MQLNAVAYRGSKQIQDFVMNKFYIITNNEKDKNLEFTDRVVDYLGKRGGHCEVQLAGRQTAGPVSYTHLIRSVRLEKNLHLRAFLHLHRSTLQG